jgi:hypothetical protein
MREALIHGDHSMSIPRTCVRLAVVLALCLLIPACIKNKVTKANFETVKEGMTIDDVQKILGKGTKDEGGDGSNVAAQFGVALESAPRVGGGTTYTWERGGNTIIVIFNKEGKVVSKRFQGS